MLNLFHSIHHYCHYCYAPGSSSHHCWISVHSSLTRTEIHQSLLDSNTVNRFVTAKSFLKFCQGKKVGTLCKKLSSNYSFITVLNVFCEIPQKKDTERCEFVVWLVLSPHDLNDFKWFQMTFGHSIDLLDTYRVIWSHFRSFGVILVTGRQN